jgi:hypothetical protein
VNEKTPGTIILTFLFIAITALALTIAYPAFPFRAGIGGSPAVPLNTVPKTVAATVGVASAQVLPADPGRASLWMCNASTAATVFWSHSTFGAAAMNTAGSAPLAPGQCAIIDNTPDTDAINMIASGASTPVTIFVWD